MDLIKSREAFDIDDTTWRIYYRHEGRLPQSLGEHADVQSSMISDGTLVFGEVKDSIISSGVVIAEGAVVKDSIIMQNATIEKGASVYHSIVAEGAVIKAGVSIGHQEIELGKDMITVIGRNEVVSEPMKAGGC